MWGGSVVRNAICTVKKNGVEIIRAVAGEWSVPRFPLLTCKEEHTLLLSVHLGRRFSPHQTQRLERAS